MRAGPLSPYDGCMDADSLRGWLDRYVRAWRTNDPEDIAGLFTDDATYDLYFDSSEAFEVWSREALLDRVWGSDYEASPEYLKVFVSRLRAKLRKAGSRLTMVTVRGVGFMLADPDATTDA